MRRYAPIAKSRGTTWPPEVRTAAYSRDHGCLGPLVGMPGDCAGAVELDHIRASGAVGMKSRSTLDNAASLCGAHHRMKTDYGKQWRPELIDFVDFMARRTRS